MTEDHDSRARPHATRTEATDGLADEWLKAVRGWDITCPYAMSEMPLELAREAFAAGMRAASSTAARSLSILGNGIGLLTEAMQRFRFYEAQHRAKVDGVFAKSRASGDDPLAKARADTLAKAEANAEIANRLEAFLMHDSTPKGRAYGDQERDRAVAILEAMPEGFTSWGRIVDDVAAALGMQRVDEMLAALRESFDGCAEEAQASTFPALLSQGDLAALQGFGQADGPGLTLVVNGSVYRTRSTSVRGKLGGCPIRVEWGGTTDLTVFIDTPGYVPPPSPPVIIYGKAALPGLPADPSHDCCELPRPCITPASPA